MKTIKHCRHVKEDGIACGSPPLRGESYCHFHLRYKGRRLRTWSGRRTLRVKDLHLPPAIDLHAIQLSLNELVRAVASGRLDLDEAGKVLHELNPASIKLRRGDVGATALEVEVAPQNWEEYLS